MKKEVKKESSKDINKKIKKSLKYSVVSGSFYGVTDGTANSYISPFAIAMNASNNQIAMLTSIPTLIGPLSELGTIKAIKLLNSRKKVVIFSSLLQTFMLIPIMLIPFLFLKNGPIALIILFSVYAIFGFFLGPAWTSWIGDLVPENKRGSFFGNRARIIGAITLAVSLGAGYFLDIFPKNRVFIGFSILFFIAFIARLFSVYFMNKKYEPKLVLKEKFQFSFVDFVKKMPFNNFGRFAIYISLINFAVYVASPFFSVYMLKDLNLSYTKFTIITIISGIAQLITLPLWGKFGDKYGNIKVLKICGLLIPVVPLLWVFSSSFYYLILIQIYAGLVWSGFNIAAANFIFDSTSVQRRAACDAYNTILSGFGAFFGATLGGILSTNLEINFMNIFLFVFIVSTVLRFSISLIMLPKIKEVREVKRTPLLEIVGLTHNRGFSHRTIGWHQYKNKKK